ncbi:DUF3306 domain-containing protein [Billgrantia gudaonensis]|uniref:DUF3306 domain-containing protein n=1 Tax=Billgrantia gudaonensis TaxID=376427 RepID=A0A1G8WK48_9GAMM|nr:DUF3306 domain-containing protein [Halomonas gudaonensis]SDJ78722.1 Protein of unknown function [Halomonas gudaonensis]
MSRLSRWSERKRAIIEDDSTSDAFDEAVTNHDAAATNEMDSDLAAPLEPGSLDHTLPDPDSLPPGSDIKAFLSSGVSAGLRRRALRRLFAADRYGVRDGLDDYDDDYRQTLKPMAGELAQRVRQWTRQAVGESDEEMTESTSEGRDAAAQASGNESDATGDETVAAHRESTADRRALDQGWSGENAKSDQH